MRYERITRPVLMQSRKTHRDPDVNLADGQPKRDSYGKALTAAAAKKANK
jgi:hypothetical protein